MNDITKSRYSLKFIFLQNAENPTKWFCWNKVIEKIIKVVMFDKKKKKVKYMCKYQLKVLYWPFLLHDCFQIIPTIQVIVNVFRRSINWPWNGAFITPWFVINIIGFIISKSTIHSLLREKEIGRIKKMTLTEKQGDFEISSLMSVWYWNIQFLMAKQCTTLKSTSHLSTFFLISTCFFKSEFLPYLLSITTFPYIDTLSFFSLISTLMATR